MAVFDCPILCAGLLGQIVHLGLFRYTATRNRLWTLSCFSSTGFIWAWFHQHKTMPSPTSTAILPIFTSLSSVTNTSTTVIMPGNEGVIISSHSANLLLEGAPLLPSLDSEPHEETVSLRLRLQEDYKVQSDLPTQRGTTLVFFCELGSLSISQDSRRERTQPVDDTKRNLEATGVIVHQNSASHNISQPSSEMSPPSLMTLARGSRPAQDA